MTDSSTVDGSAKKIAKVRKLAHEGAALVSGYKLAAHFGMTRQNVDALVSQGVIERRADGKFDQDQSRLKYLTHLRSKSRRSSRAAADAEHLKVKTEMLQLRVMEKRRELVQLDEVNAMIDALVGLMQTQMSGMPARIGGHDLQLRRRVDQVVYETRVAMSQAATKMADEAGEAPLAER